MAKRSEELQLHGLRGAITAKANSPEAIEDAVSELISELIVRNELIPALNVATGTGSTLNA